MLHLSSLHQRQMVADALNRTQRALVEMFGNGKFGYSVLFPYLVGNDDGDWHLSGCDHDDLEIKAVTRSLGLRKMVSLCLYDHVRHVHVSPPIPGPCLPIQVCKSLPYLYQTSTGQMTR